MLDQNLGDPASIMDAGPLPGISAEVLRPTNADKKPPEVGKSDSTRPAQDGTITVSIMLDAGQNAWKPTQYDLKQEKDGENDMKQGKAACTEDEFQKFQPQDMAIQDQRAYTLKKQFGGEVEKDLMPEKMEKISSSKGIFVDYRLTGYCYPTDSPSTTTAQVKGANKDADMMKMIVRAPNPVGDAYGDTSACWPDFNGYCSYTPSVSYLSPNSLKEQEYESTEAHWPSQPYDRIKIGLHAPRAYAPKKLFDDDVDDGILQAKEKKLQEKEKKMQDKGKKLVKPTKVQLFVANQLESAKYQPNVDVASKKMDYGHQAKRSPYNRYTFSMSSGIVKRYNETGYCYLDNQPSTSSAQATPSACNVVNENIMETPNQGRDSVPGTSGELSSGHRMKRFYVERSSMPSTSGVSSNDLKEKQADQPSTSEGHQVSANNLMQEQAEQPSTSCGPQLRTPRAAPGTPRAAPGTPQAAPGTPPAAPGTPEGQWPDLSETIQKTPRDIRRNLFGEPPAEHLGLGLAPDLVGQFIALRGNRFPPSAPKKSSYKNSLKKRGLARGPPPLPFQPGSPMVGRQNGLEVHVPTPQSVRANLFGDELQRPGLGLAPNLVAGFNGLTRQSPGRTPPTPRKSKSPRY